MATVRNRPNAQLMLPRDENADAVGKISSRGGNGGLGGKVLQQQAKSVDRPRKLLGDITNVKNILPYPASKVETPKPSSSKTATGGSENVWKDGGKSASSAKAARVPLRNITNASQLKGASSREVGTAGKQKVPVLSSQPGTVNAGPKVQQPIGAENIDAKIQRWAEEGIEEVHFTADNMDALRQKIENEEMEKRVAKVLSYRTDFPRLWQPTAEPPQTKPLDVLELDHISDRQFHSYASSEDDEPMSLATPDYEDHFISNTTTDDDVLGSHLNWDAINLSVRPY